MKVNGQGRKKLGQGIPGSERICIEMHNIVIRPENIVNRCVCTIFSLEVFHAGAMKE